MRIGTIGEWNIGPLPSVNGAWVPSVSSCRKKGCAFTGPSPRAEMYSAIAGSARMSWCPSQLYIGAESAPLPRAAMASAPLLTPDVLLRAALGLPLRLSFWDKECHQSAGMVHLGLPDGGGGSAKAGFKRGQCRPSQIRLGRTKEI